MSPYYYTHEASTYCDGCAPKGADPVFLAEADWPQHCEGCKALLDCSMTEDGLAYIAEAVIEHAETGRGNRAVVLSWTDEYSDWWEHAEPRELADALLALMPREGGAA